MTSNTLLGHPFADPRLLEQALTHRSASHANNERLEFLGDALLNLFVAELVYECHPRADEGAMTRLRAALVNGPALAGIARGEGIGECLHLGPGELKSGGFRRDSILADAFEALLAAVYLDAGWSACRLLVRRLFAERVQAGATTPKDAKTQLQEWLLDSLRLLLCCRSARPYSCAAECDALPSTGFASQIFCPGCA